MRYHHVFILLVAWLLSNVIACASRRSTYSEDAEHVQAIRRTEKRTTDSQTHRLTIASHLDSLGYRETATITPLGHFTYHPDLGFRGYATLVQLQRRGVRTERHSLHDSAQHLYRSSAEVSDSVATKEAHTVDRREKRHTPWRWLAAALLLVLAMGFLARRFFR